MNRFRELLLGTTCLGAAHPALMPWATWRALLTDPNGILKEYYQPRRRKGSRRPRRRR